MIVFTEPQPGTSVTAGRPLRVAVEIGGGAVPDRVLFTTKYDTELVVSPPFAAYLNVPREAIGDLYVEAVATKGRLEWQRNELGHFELLEPMDGFQMTTASVTVAIDVPAALTEIAIGSAQILLSDFAPRHEVAVLGIFDDGVRRRLKEAGMPIRYRVEDESVATVDARGIMTAVSSGRTVVEAVYGDLAATAEVFVDSASASDGLH
ncbi:MAG: Ig-like domain-containing protein [Planctomycetota bacterium]